MYTLEGHIDIGAYRFKVIHSVEYTKSVDELVDTALIKLPKAFKIKKNNTLIYTEKAIKIGDTVSITIGYKGVYSGTEFKGFVAKVKPAYPVEIHVEDAMWLLRRKNINKIWNEPTTLKEILQEVVAGTPLRLAKNIPDVKMDKFIIKNTNGTQVLQKLKQAPYSLSIYINDDNELYCGLQQGTNIGQEAIYDLNYNIVENNLEFKTAEERKIKVRYTYIDGENNKKEIEEGDIDGELRTYHTSVISDEAMLRKMAKAEIDKLKYDGFDGSLTGFLVPFATRGVKATIQNKEYAYQEGSYFIKKVSVSFGTGGARRKVELGSKI